MLLTNCFAPLAVSESQSDRVSRAFASRAQLGQNRAADHDSEGQEPTDL